MRGLATRKTQSVYAARSLEGGSRGVRSAGAKNLAEHATRPRFVLDGGLTRPGARAHVLDGPQLTEHCSQTSGPVSRHTERLESREGNVHARRLAYLSIYVSDLDKSRRFYGDLLGLPILRQEEWGDVVQAGELQLFLHPRDDVDQPSQRLEMTFDVDDADDAIADLRAHGTPVLEEATDRDWGDRDGAVEDPDGNIIYLRSSPPAG